MADDNQPPERDVKDFQFRQLVKIRVSPSPTNLPTARVQLIVASKYGITFVGTSSGFKVIQTEAIRKADELASADRLQFIVTDIATLADVTIPEPVTGLALSCDDLTLAVAIRLTDVSVVLLYDVRSITAQMVPFLSARVNGSLGSELLDIAWNPVTPNLLVSCLSDGQLDMFEITDKFGVKASLKGAGAMCVCWSPKGKQLVVGKQDGSLMQYDPELKEKRKWDSPAVLGEDPYQALDIIWLSTYTFIVSYIGHGADCSDQPHLILINGSKDQPPTYSNYEDICFGTGEDRQRKYSFNFVTKWDMVLAGSSNASELGVIGKHLDDKQSWEHWNLDDAARAECPLTDDYVDTYPMGIAVDYTSQTPVALGDNVTRPPCPMVMLLSTEGVIIPYHMMYSHKQTPVITVVADRLPITGTRQPPAGQSSRPTGVFTASGTGQSQPKNLFGAGQTAPSKMQPKNLFGVGETSTAGSQSQPANLLGAGQTTAGQSQPTNLFAAPQTSAPTSQSQPTNIFGEGQTTASQSQPKNLFAAAQASAPASQSEAKTAFGAGLGSNAFSFAAPTASSANSAQISSSTSAAAFNYSALQSATNSPFSFTTQGSETGTFSSTTAFGSSLGAPAVALDGPSRSTSTTSAASFGDGKGPAPSYGALASTITVAKTSIPATVPPSQPGFGTVSSSAAGVGVQKRGAPSSAGTQLERSSAEVATRGQSAGFGMRPIATAMPTSAAGQPKPAAVSKPLAPRSPTRKSPGPRPPQYAAPSSHEAAGVAVDTRELISATVDHSFSKSILEEMQHFEKELRDLKSRASNSDVSVGSRDETRVLRQQTEQLDVFCTEIKKTLKEQSKEVQEQSTLCLDMFSMAEECRLREQMNSDDKYSHLLKSRALDPGSADRLQCLQLQCQVLHQGLGDVDLILDTEWDEYQQRKKNKTNRLQAPTNDAVYRVVKSNNNLILAQRKSVTQLERRLKQLKLYNKTSAWQNSTLRSSRGNDSTELSSLADSLLNPPPSPVKAASVSSGGSSISSDRLAQLREHLYRRPVPIIKSTKPENLSLSKIAMPDDHLQQLVCREKSPKRSPQRSPMPSTSGTGLPGEFVGMRRRSTLTQPPPPKATTQPSRPVPTAAAPRKPAPAPVASTGSQLSNRPVMGTNVMMGTSKLSEFGANLPNLNTVAGLQLQGNAMFNLNQMANMSTTQGQALRVREINGIQLEDITPSQSEGDTLDEDDEYDDDDDSESNGEGFGDEYNMLAPNIQGIGITSTPVPTGSRPAGASTATPVSRQLFGTGTDPSQSAGSFNFGAGDTPATFTFGTANSTLPKKTTDKPDTSAAKPFNFTPAAPTTTTSSAPGFNFSFSTGAPSFGVATEPGAKQADEMPDVMPGSTSAQEKGEEIGTATAGFTFGSSSGVQSGAGVFSQTLQPGTSAPGGSPTLKTSKSGSLLELVAAADNEERTGIRQGDTLHDGATSAASGIKPPSTASEVTPVLSSLLTIPDSPTPASEQTGSGPSSLGSDSSQVTGSSATVDLSAVTTSTMPTAGMFGQSALSSGVTPPTAGQFGQSQAGSTSSEGLFGQKSTSSSSGNLFGGASTTASTSLFGTATASSTGALFGGPSPVTGALFGQASATTTSLTTSTGTDASAGQISAPTASTTSTSSGLFGQTSVSSTGGLFGQASTPTTSSGGALFGQAAPTTSTSLFGQATTTTTESTGLFGQASTSTTTASTALFGQSSATTASAGLFGQSSSATSASSDIFGQSATTTAAPTTLFGQSSTTTDLTTWSFGQSTATTTATTGFGLFSQPATTAPSTGLFSQPATTAPSTGLFSQPATTAPSTGLFSQPATTAPSTGLFSQPATTATSTGLFSQPATTAPGLFGSSTAGSGFGQPAFGQSAQSTGFGQPAFGQTAGFSSPSSSSGSGPAFDQKTDSGTGEGGGSFFSGLGGKPSEEKANTNVFGSGQLFGSTNQTAGLFGGETAKTFGGSAPGGETGGPFSGGGGGGGGFGSTGAVGVAATGFGATQQPAAGAFGNPPAFGGSPAFGAAPKFGSGASFGSPPSYGSGGTFGSAATFGSSMTGASTFGTDATSSANTAGFAGFAGGNSPTFGSLAQTSDPPTFGSLGQSGGEGGNVFGGGGAGFGGPSFGGAGQQPAQTFGGAGQQPAQTFGGAGQQPTQTFGGAGQQPAQTFGGAGQPPPPAFGGGGNTFGSSPSFSGYRS